MLRRSQTRQAQLGLSCKANKCIDTGTGDLGVLTTHETSPMEMTKIPSTHLATAAIKADLESLSDHARWRKDWVKVSSELAQDRRAWSASVQDVVNSIGDAGSPRPGGMPKQVHAT